MDLSDCVIVAADQQRDGTPTPKSIGEGLKGPQRKLRKEALFVKYDKKRNVGLLLAPIPIKSRPKG